MVQRVPHRFNSCGNLEPGFLSDSFWLLCAVPGRAYLLPRLSWHSFLFLRSVSFPFLSPQHSLHSSCIVVGVIALKI